MAFQFVNYASPELQKSSLNDMISNALSGYTGMTQARYLQPTLSEALRNAQLQNQYYGPNIESQIGLRNSQMRGQDITNRFLPQTLQSQSALRNAQTGLIGEQTKGTHIKNQSLPQLLQAQVQAAILQQEQNKMFNQILKQRMSDQTSNNINQQGEYQPGMGNSPFAQQSSQNIPQTAQDIESMYSEGLTIPNEPLSLQKQQPELTADDIFNKKFLGLDTYAPKAEIYKKEQEQVNKLNIEQANNYEKEIPILIDQYKDANYVAKEIKNHPEWFGPGIMGIGFLGGPSYRERHINDKSYGAFVDKMNKIVARGAQNLSSKPLALALTTSLQNKINFNENSNVAEGKANAIKTDILRTIIRANNFYKQVKGHDLVNSKILHDALENLNESDIPTVPVEYNGQFFDVPMNQVNKFKDKPGVKIGR